MVTASSSIRGRGVDDDGATGGGGGDAAAGGCWAPAVPCTRGNSRCHSIVRRSRGRDAVCILLQLGGVLVECLLAIGTELIAALREQYVSHDDPFLLLLHFVNLNLFSRRLRAPAAISPSACRMCCAIRPRSTSTEWPGTCKREKSAPPADPRLMISTRSWLRVRSGRCPAISRCATT